MEFSKKLASRTIQSTLPRIPKEEAKNPPRVQIHLFVERGKYCPLHVCSLLNVRQIGGFVITISLKATT